MKKFAVSFFVLSLFLGGIWAQNRGMAGNRGGAGSAQPKTLLTITGTVEEVDLGLGQGSPTITVAGSKVVLGPYYLLQRVGFSVNVEDQVEVVAFASLVYEDVLIAVSINNITTGQQVDLRSESGQPLRRSSRRQGNSGQGACGGEPNVEAAQTLVGQVVSVSAGLGERYPTITLDTGETITVGPYRLWVEADFSVAEGEQVSILAFPCAADSDRWVAMTITKMSDGTSVVLRDDSGMPTGGRGWSRGGRCSIIPQ